MNAFLSVKRAPKRLVVFLWAAAVMAAVGCSSNARPSGPVDAGRDVSIDATGTDGRRQDAADGDLDLPADDAGPDFPMARELGVDFPKTDATLSPATVLYITTKTPDSFGLREVSADGQGTPKPVVGFSGLIDFGTLRLAGLQPALAIDPARPRVEERVSFTCIRLPSHHGDLYLFRRVLTATSGILQVGMAGSPSPRILYETAGLYADTIGLHVAVDRLGTRGVLVAHQREVVVMRFDGTTFADGKASRALTTPADVKEVASDSLTLAGTWVYAVGTRKDGTTVLLRARIDASADLALKAVALGAPAKEPTFVASDVIVSGDGAFVFVRAGATPTKLDLYRVSVVGMGVLNATKVGVPMAGRGGRFGASEARVAVSPHGGCVAYVVRDAGGEELYVTLGDGSGKLQNPTDATSFAAGGMSAIYNLVFLDEDRLLFMAGVGPSQLDLYRYDAKTKQIENLSGIGSTTPPFDGMGGFSSRSAWVDEVAGFFYLLIYDSVTSEQGLWGVPLAGGALKRLTQSGQLGGQASDYAICPSTRQLYVIARPDPKRYQFQLIAADLKAGTARQLTGLGGGGIWQMTHVWLSDNCKRLFVTGGAFLSEARLFVMEPASPTSFRPITTVPRTIGPTLALTPDGSTIVYASGGASDAMTLKAVLSAGSAETVLDPTGGAVQVLATY